LNTIHKKIVLCRSDFSYDFSYKIYETYGMICPNSAAGAFELLAVYVGALGLEVPQVIVSDLRGSRARSETLVVQRPEIRVVEPTGCLP
jgi:hypothetical protein